MSAHDWVKLPSGRFVNLARYTDIQAMRDEVGTIRMWSDTGNSAEWDSASGEDAVAILAALDAATKAPR